MECREFSKRNKTVAAFYWVSARENFLLRMTLDGLYEPHSDLVARVQAEGLDRRLVVPAGTARLRPGRVRAALIRPLLQNIGVSPRVSDTLYLDALRQDGARRLKLTTAWVRARGYLRHLWRYDRVGGL
jgi:hypothetical protein